MTPLFRGGRNFVDVTGGGVTSYVAIGSTAMSLPAGTLVSFEPGRLTTSLAGMCPRWQFMARFGGRSVGDTRLEAGSWTDEAASVGGVLSYVLVRAEAMTWSASCYDHAGEPMALPQFTARLEFLTAASFS